MKRRNLILATPALMLGASSWAKTKVKPVVQATVPSLVKFGMSASLTGGQAAYGTDVRDGVMAAFAAANKQAGSKGVQFELVALDDGGHREKSEANVKTLIDADVSALIGLTSGAAAEAVLPLLEKNQIVLLGAATGSMAVRNSAVTTAFHSRAGYDSEYRGMIKYVKGLNMKRIGYVNLKDISAANQAAMNAALDEVGLKLSLVVSVDRHGKEFDAEIARLLGAKLDCIMFTTNGGPAEAIMTGMSNAKYMGTYFSSSFAGQNLINNMGKKGISFIMSQVVPRPQSRSLAVVKRYREDMAAFTSSPNLGYTSLEGYIAGRVAIEGVRAAVKSGATVIDRAAFKSALSELSVDLGGYPVRFAGGSHQGSKFVDVVALNRYGKVIS
jgi:branched-chain amino acid transport system substrate-binding protein